MDGLYNEPTAQSRPVVGKIHKAPTSLADKVEVVIEDFGADHVWGPMGWSTRGELLPIVGHECLVVFDQRGNPWMVAWE